MTNLSNATREEMQAYEAKLELSNRIHLRERLNHLMLHPNSDIEDIMNFARLINEMVDLSLKKQKLDHADVKALSRERELSLAESRVEVQKEAQALARAKLESKQMPTENQREAEPQKMTPSLPPTSSPQPTGRSEQFALSKADADGKRSSNITPINNTAASTTMLGAQSLAKVGS